MAIMQVKDFNPLDWDRKEFDWTGKSFYFVSLMNIFSNPIGLGGKLELVNRELRANGYRAISNMMLVEYKMFGGKVMVEIEKQDKYDAQVLTYDDKTTVETMVHTAASGGLSNAITKLKERTTSRRGMQPRALYYWPVQGVGSKTNILFSIT